MDLRIDYKMALEMTYGMLILEMIHRVIVCTFEVRASLFKVIWKLHSFGYLPDILASAWCKWLYRRGNAWKIFDGITGCSVS